MFIAIAQAYLCAEGHITDNATQCDCGEKNLASLAKILDRKPAPEIAKQIAFLGLSYRCPSGVMAQIESLPTLRILEAEHKTP